MDANAAARLRDAQNALSTWYDRLNDQWRDAELIARGCGLSDDVWIHFRNETWDSPNGDPSLIRAIEHGLGYHKFDGEWRICYSIGESGDPDSHSIKPILECTAQQRKLALEGLPLLINEMVARTEAAAEEFELLLGRAAEVLSPFKRLPKNSTFTPNLWDSMKVREVLRILKDDGWNEVVTRGSHRQLKHATKPGRVTVAGKPNDELPPGTLNSILKQAGLK